MGDRQFNLADLFEVVADTVPGRLALVAGTSRLTYRQLDERANRFAHYLSDQGVAAGAHVGILSYNRAEWVEAMIGCYKARAVPVNLNYRYVAPELRYVIDNADLEVLVFERALAPLVAEATEGVERRHSPDAGDDRGRVGGGHVRSSDRPLRVRPRLVVPRPRLRVPLTRRHLHPLHGRDHGHAQRRPVAPGGHLLRGHGRWRLGVRADHPRRRAGGTAQSRRRHPGGDAGGGAAHARQRPVGHVERLHDGRHRRPVHRTPLRPRRPVAHRRARRGWSRWGWSATPWPDRWPTPWPTHRPAPTTRRAWWWWDPVAPCCPRR